jgi:hypothetical protein
MVLDQEIVAWVSVEESLPDADTTVLVNAPGASEPVWLGYYDGVYWFSVDGGCYDTEDDSEIAQAVVAWAPMPRGTWVTTNKGEGT